MNRNLIIVSSHPTMYGSFDGLLPDAASLVSKFIYEKDVTPEAIDRIRSYVENHDILGVVSRGDWAACLDRELSIPVFPFLVDAFDLLQNLDFVAKKGFHSIGLFGSMGNQGGSYSYGSIHTIRLGEALLLMAHVKTADEARFLLDRMTHQYQVEAAIGDCEFQEIVTEAGYPYYPYQLSSEFLGRALASAAHSVQIANQRKRNLSYVTAITNIMNDASIIANEEGTILFSNQHAKEYFHIKEKQLTDIHELIPLENLKAVKANQFLKIGNSHYVLNVLPLSLNGEPCYSYLFSSTKSIETAEISIRRQQHANGLSAKYRFDDIIHADPLMEKIIRTARKYAPSDGTVLITGESGTGKEVFSNAIHNASRRSEGPFVAINCATLSENLIESELFGYEKGAFTGALSSGKKGLFELAHNGTLFLDEIGELPVSMQAKLLRVLQEHEVRHIGGEKNIPVNVRIIAATNKDLLKMVEDGQFREDLYYRLSLLELRLPAIRERPGDIIVLFQHFIRELGEKSSLKIYWTNDAVFSPLLEYSWPGNIRELRNIAERAVLLSDDLNLTEVYLRELLPYRFGQPPKDKPAACPVPSAAASNVQPKASDLPCEKPPAELPAPFLFSDTPDLARLETQYIQYLLKQHKGNKNIVCQLLGISKATLWRKMNGKEKDEQHGT